MPLPLANSNLIPNCKFFDTRTLVAAASQLFDSADPSHGLLRKNLVSRDVHGMPWGCTRARARSSGSGVGLVLVLVLVALLVRCGGCGGCGGARARISLNTGRNRGAKGEPRADRETGFLLFQVQVG